MPSFGAHFGIKNSNKKETKKQKQYGINISRGHGKLKPNPMSFQKSLFQNPGINVEINLRVRKSMIVDFSAVPDLPILEHGLHIPVIICFSHNALPDDRSGGFERWAGSPGLGCSSAVGTGARRQPAPDGRIVVAAMFMAGSRPTPVMHFTMSVPHIGILFFDLRFRPPMQTCTSRGRRLCLFCFGMLIEGQVTFFSRLYGSREIIEPRMHQPEPPLRPSVKGALLLWV